ncbi:hypothetical protein GCM10025794_35470 [Massilia kyonggiensis]
MVRLLSNPHVSMLQTALRSTGRLRFPKAEGVQSDEPAGVMPV